MSISKRRLRKIAVKNRIFYWGVQDNNKDEGRVYLTIKFDDKKFIVSLYA